MEITDLKGTTWVFGMALKADYTTSFSYDITWDYVISYNGTTETGTRTSFPLYVMGQNYYFPSNQGGNSGGFTSELLYYGYSGVPTANFGNYPNFEYFAITITGGFSVTNPSLIAWLEANALLVKKTTPTEPTEITYNGSVIASLDAGQTATMSCAGKKMASDIAIVFGVAGTITYNDTGTAVEAGQTATMLCEWKKMLTDVIVRLAPFYTSSAVTTDSDTVLTASVNCNVGDLVVAAIATRDTLTLSDGWTLVSTSGINSADTTNGQRLSWAWKFAESTTEAITVTQASAQRLYINMVALQGATGVTDNGYSYRDDATSGSLTVSKPNGLVLWGMTAPLWTTTVPYAGWKVSSNIPIVQLDFSTQQRLGLALDQTDEASVTFTGQSTETTMIVGSLSVHGMDRFY